MLPSYEAAGQAQEGPTIMYLWGGIYTMDAVWKGWIVPISDYVGMDEAEHYINKEEATWDGKIWSAAWYLQPSYPIVYNKDAFTAAGLDPEAPPQTWDEFLAACDAFAAQDMPLVGLGVKDTWGAGRFLLDSLAQQVTGVGEVLAGRDRRDQLHRPQVRDLLRALAGDDRPRLLPGRRRLTRHVHRSATRAAG